MKFIAEKDDDIWLSTDSMHFVHQERSVNYNTVWTSLVMLLPLGLGIFVHPIFLVGVLTILAFILCTETDGILIRGKSKCLTEYKGFGRWPYHGSVDIRREYHLEPIYQEAIRAFVSDQSRGKYESTYWINQFNKLNRTMEQMLAARKKQEEERKSNALPDFAAQAAEMKELMYPKDK